MTKNPAIEKMADDFLNLCREHGYGGTIIYHKMEPLRRAHPLLVKATVLDLEIQRASNMPAALSESIIKKVAESLF